VEAVKKAIRLPGHMAFISMVVIGYPEEALKTEVKDRKPLKRFIHYGAFGS
jgi:hypothetical protein